MTKQTEMIQQLELLKSKYGKGNDYYDVVAFQSRYEIISHAIANQIDPTLFYNPLFNNSIISGYGDGDKYTTTLKTLRNRFELIENELPPIMDGIIYLYDIHGSSDYILTFLRNPSYPNRFFVMYGYFHSNQNIQWESSGYGGWRGATNNTAKESMKKWLGYGDLYRLKGYDFSDPKTHTLNYSRKGFNNQNI